MPLAADKPLDEAIKTVISRYVGSAVVVDLNRYATILNSPLMARLKEAQRTQLVEDIVTRHIRPHTSIGKATLARVELLSILQVNAIASRPIQAGKERNILQAAPTTLSTDPIAGGRKVDLTTKAAPIWNNPAALPGPSTHALSEEMKNEFLRLQNEQYAALDIINWRLNDEETTVSSINTVVTELLGTLSHFALRHAREMTGTYPLKGILQRNLTMYMGLEDAQEAQNRFMSTVRRIHKGADSQLPAGEIEERISKGLRTYFDDYNQLLLRRLLNKYGMRSIDEQKRQPMKKALMKDFMEYYFGRMSGRYVEVFIDKNLKDRGDVDAAFEMGLIDATVRDGIRTLMSPEDAKTTYNGFRDIMAL